MKRQGLITPGMERVVGAGPEAEAEGEGGVARRETPVNQSTVGVDSVNKLAMSNATRQLKTLRVEGHAENDA
jgi:hypothetical protein